MEVWYALLFYYGKIVCYLWKHKHHKKPYLGIVEGKQLNHPRFLQENRARMKILLIDSATNVDVKTLRLILTQTLALYRQ